MMLWHGGSSPVWMWHGGRSPVMFWHGGRSPVLMWHGGRSSPVWMWHGGRSPVMLFVVHALHNYSFELLSIDFFISTMDLVPGCCDPNYAVD